MSEVWQREQLVALEADIARKVEVVLLIMDLLVELAARGNLELLGEVQSEDPLLVDLHEHWEASMVTDSLTEGQCRASD